jgi:transcriptional regulator with GAF, ATPase, and Fis domain
MGKNLSRQILRSNEQGSEVRLHSELEVLRVAVDAAAHAVDSLETLELDLMLSQVGEHEVDFYDTVRTFEIALITSALKRAGGVQAKAAYFLNLKVTTLNSKMKGYEIQRRNTTRQRT